MQKADIKTTLNLNNFEDFVTPYTLGLVLGNLKSCPIRVGDIIISTISDNPSTYYAGTQWTLFGQGRTLVGIDTSQSEFNTVLKTGGNKNMQSHNHTGTTSTNGNHNHNNSWDGDSIGAGSHFKYIVTGGGSNWGAPTNTTGNHNHTFTTDNTGSGNAQNLQPYITVYMWKRTA